jgi:hypothetical protein
VHPDVGGAARANEMAELNEAFRVLRDPEKRRRYDLTLRGVPVAEMPAWVVQDVDDVPPPSMVGIRRFPWLLIVAAMFVIFVASAFVGGKSSTSDPVDGVVRPGSCVVATSGGQVAEAACTGAYDGTVNSLVGFDADCPFGTLAFRSTATPLKVCVTPRSQ